VTVEEFQGGNRTRLTPAEYNMGTRPGARIPAWSATYWYLNRTSTRPPSTGAWNQWPTQGRPRLRRRHGSFKMVYLRHAGGIPCLWHVLQEPLLCSRCQGWCASTFRKHPHSASGVHGRRLRHRTARMRCAREGRSPTSRNDMAAALSKGCALALRPPSGTPPSLPFASAQPRSPGYPAQPSPL